MSGADKLLLLAAGLFLVLLGMGLAGFIRTAPRKRKGKGRGGGKPDLGQFSKWVVADVRPLLWLVTTGGLLLAAYCIRTGYTGSLPWISAMVGLPWTAHGVVCSFYLNLCKSDHRRGGITYDAAKAANFNVPKADSDQEPEGSIDSPAI
ncbi:hypothetical protein NE539_01925 [Flavonifractor plautii]|jgi:hypothetical protein|uniref:hypothetical protein n=1 Tax=Flavonifractor plautii TaxID=292800 RepID=UPI00210CF5B0|nr:hypothetical protein [Flavonifractor plautii]MCQ4992057.1 hypothetical protein [Flavonifractor plautii]